MTVQLRDATVAIIGIGLLGGSVGMALEGHCARRIGVVRPGDDEGARAAIERGAVDETRALDAAVAAADLVIFATPVEVTVELIANVSTHLTEGTVLTDLGSTKRVVVDAMRALDPPVLAVGGHPMRGGIEHGIAHARGDLVRGGSWALCEAHDPEGNARRIVEELVVAANATPVWLDAHEHDAIVARTSHLPYVLAQSLAHAASGVQHHGLAGAGLAGATRLAAGDVAMWGGVLRTNGDEVVAAIGELQRTLDEAATRIAAGAPLGELDSWLGRGRVLARGDEASEPGALPG
ncbi:MAG: Prephenate dehydrogenase [Thermoleophilia bacterium]|nr:Prephenate dehydrogenase [Thermoleophilia bacterium]